MFKVHVDPGKREYLRPSDTSIHSNRNNLETFGCHFTFDPLLFVLGQKPDPTIVYRQIFELGQGIHLKGPSIDGPVKNRAEDHDPVKEAEAEAEGEKKDDGLDTTQDELQAFMIAKAILAPLVDLARIAHRDTKSYFGVLVDDNNRKPLCRFHFNRSQWYLGVFDEDKNEERIPIGKLDEIYQHADRVKKAVSFYEEGVTV